MSLPSTPHCRLQCATWDASCWYRRRGRSNHRRAENKQWRAAGVTVGASAQPLVKGQVAGNALPGSVIAGNARAAQQTAIGDLTTSFAKFAAARPVTVTEKTVAGVVGTNTKDINGRATDPKVPNVTLTSNTDWKAPTGNLFSLKPGEGRGLSG